jgi:hypothetical protein
MSDSFTRDLIKDLVKMLYQCDWPNPSKIYATIKRAQDYLQDTKLEEQITEAENERRFKKCMELIDNLQPGDLENLMGEKFIEEFKRVARRQ